jgi:hypothetical protein
MPQIKIKRGGQKVNTFPTLHVLVSILVFEDRQSGWMVCGDILLYFSSDSGTLS